MKINLNPFAFPLYVSLILGAVLIMGCTKEDIEKVVTEVIEDNIEIPSNDTNNNDSSNDNNNNDSTVQTEEREIVTSSYEDGELSSESITRLVYEDGRIVKEIFPDLAAGVEGKFITKEYIYNDQKLITSIIISDEFIGTEDRIYNLEYDENDVIVKFIEERNDDDSSVIKLIYLQTNTDGDWEYVNERSEDESIVVIGFDTHLNLTRFEAKSAVVTDTSSLFFANTYNSDITGFYPNAPKYFSFLSWMTTVFNFFPSDGHYMAPSALETSIEFWGSEEEYRNENFDRESHTLTYTTELDSEGNLIKLIGSDAEGLILTVEVN